MEFSIFITLFSILFGGLLGVYALGFRIMNNVNAKIDDHVSDTTVHVDPEYPLRTIEVCEEREKRNEVHFDNLANGQQRIEDKIDKLMER